MDEENRGQSRPRDSIVAGEKVLARKPSCHRLCLRTEFRFRNFVGRVRAVVGVALSILRKQMHIGRVGAMPGLARWVGVAWLPEVDFPRGESITRALIPHL